MSDQTPDEEADVDPAERFTWNGPLLRLAPDEVYVPATIEELLEGKSGRIVKNPDLVPEPTVVASAAAKADHPSRWRRT